MKFGKIMYGWAKDLFPLCRSLTGSGVVQTLEYFKRILPQLSIIQVPSGTKAFDWELPDEWEIEDACIMSGGRRLISFKDNNLHIVGYSMPIDKELDFEELESHLYTLPDMPEAIPYVSSYYKRDWGFCLSEVQKKQLFRKGEKYRVVIKSKLFKGQLTYGELFLKGGSEKEILISANICHPSLANNELSGPITAACLAQELSKSECRYSLRFLFLPETIGAVYYLSRNLEHLKEHLLAGFVVTCIGDNRGYSYLASRYGCTTADRAAKYALGQIDPDYKRYSFLERGSDERQYCAPGVDLPVCSIMRTKYGEYPEYHSSLDDLSLISPEGLEGGYNAVYGAVKALELNRVYKTTVLCEPQLGRRGLYPALSMKGSAEGVRSMMNLIAYADGTNDLISISEITHEHIEDLACTAEMLEKKGILERI